MITEDGLKDILLSTSEKLTEWGTTDLIVAGMLLSLNLKDVDSVVKKIKDARDLSRSLHLDEEREILMHILHYLKDFVNDCDGVQENFLSNNYDTFQDLDKTEDLEYNHSFQNLYLSNSINVKEEIQNFDESQMTGWEEEILPKLEINSENTFNSFGKKSMYEKNEFIIEEDNDEELNDFMLTVQGNSPSFGEYKLKEDLEQIEAAAMEKWKKRKARSRDKSNKKKKPKGKVQQSLSKTTWCICAEDNRSEDLMSNVRWNHMYHKDCLKNNILEKIDSLIFPFRCPANPCRTNMPRDIIIPLLNEKQVRMYDDLHLINRVEKGKRVLLWWWSCNVLFSVFKKDSQACLKWTEIGINVRKVLNYKYQEEIPDDEYGKLKDQIDLDKYWSKKQRRDFLELEKVLKRKVKRCMKWFDWEQNISGLENFKWIPSKWKGVKKNKNKKAS